MSCQKPSSDNLKKLNISAVLDGYYIQNKQTTATMQSFSKVDDLSLPVWESLLKSSYIEGFCGELVQDLPDEDGRCDVMQKYLSGRTLDEDEIETIMELLVEPDDDESIWGYTEETKIGTLFIMDIPSQYHTYGIIVKNNLIMGEFICDNEANSKHTEVIFARKPEFRIYYPEFVSSYRKELAD